MSVGEKGSALVRRVMGKPLWVHTAGQKGGESKDVCPAEVTHQHEAVEPRAHAERAPTNTECEHHLLTHTCPPVHGARRWQ